MANVLGVNRVKNASAHGERLGELIVGPLSSRITAEAC
jgi:hypothetical protein